MEVKYISVSNEFPKFAEMPERRNKHSNWLQLLENDSILHFTPNYLTQAYDRKYEEEIKNCFGQQCLTSWQSLEQHK